MSKTIRSTSDRHADLMKRRAAAQAIAAAKRAKRGAPRTTLSDETRTKVAELKRNHEMLPSERLVIAVAEEGARVLAETERTVEMPAAVNLTATKKKKA